MCGLIKTTNVTINANGIPYLLSNNVQVTTDSVEYTLVPRLIPTVGLFALKIANAIPAGTPGTLPIKIKINGQYGQTRALTFFGGEAVTAADLVGTGVLVVMYNWYDGTMQLLSVVPSGAATTAESGE